MRLRIDRGAEALRLDLLEVPEARRAEVADGVGVAYDGTGRIVGIELRGIDVAALHAVTVELAGLTDRPAALVASRGTPPSSPPSSRPAPEPPSEPFTGHLIWDADAEAAMLQIPFFSRGRHRLAASALARRRGLDRVSLDIVRSLGR